MIKNISLVVLIVAYVLLGLNHFRSPATYTGIIPSYLPNPKLLNFLAGVAEVGFALAMAFPQTRAYGAWGIILMLLAFMPVHVDMILRAPFKLGNFTVTPLIAWLRIPLQGLLILWAWWLR